MLNHMNNNKFQMEIEAIESYLRSQRINGLEESAILVKRLIALQAAAKVKLEKLMLGGLR